MSASLVCRPLRLSYFLRVPNVGDRINPAIVTAISGRHTAHVAGCCEPHLVAVGSVMSATTPASLVWSTGVMHPDLGVGGVTPSNVYAVRGKLTHSALQTTGMKLRDVPLGDAGYLAPELLGISRFEFPTHTLGVVPHYVDRHNAHFRRLLDEPGVLELNVHDRPEQFLQAMASCKAIISSSLHGLVFAEALGIPNLWVTAGDEIAGGPFKFNDWFSTTAKPQPTAHALSPRDTSEELFQRATLHDSTIDIEALKLSFRKGRLDDICEAEARSLLPTEECRSRPMPTFLISYNRSTELKDVIKSINRLDRPTEIIVHDNGSTDAATLETLQEIETSGTRVVRAEAISCADDLNRVNDTVQDFFSNWAEPSRYIVSDCDIDMAIAAPETLDVYDELLNIHRRVECVGPMLRISDITTDYPLFNRVINRHIEQFWHKRPDWTETSFGPVAYQHTGIDTTFAMQRAGEPYRRLKEALRVYEPYEAQHLDWYIRSIGDDVYSKTSSAAVSHWNNISELAMHQSVGLEHESYFVVSKNQEGTFEVIEELVKQPGPIRPFVDATETQRAARISHTEALRSRKGTDIERWQNTASHYESWQQRGQLLAGLVNRGERVFEFGAGSSVVRALLPSECSYQGSDAAPLTADVIQLDLNASTLPQLRGYDVGLFSGVLEYIHDLPRLTAFLAETFSSVICSYAPLADNTAAEIARRRYSGWFNDLTLEQFCDLFHRPGFCLTRQQEWAGQVLFRWDRS